MGKKKKNILKIIKNIKKKISKQAIHKIIKRDKNCKPKKKKTVKK